MGVYTFNLSPREVEAGWPLFQIDLHIEFQDIQCYVERPYDKKQKQKRKK